MTKVDFYTGSADKLRTACLLSHKALQNQRRVLLHLPNQTLAQQLDKLLWQVPIHAFMPHCFSHQPDAADAPIVLACDENFPHSDILISLHSVTLPFFSRFERTIEIVGLEAEDAQLGRERFSFYRDRGYEMRHFDLRQTANA